MDCSTGNVLYAFMGGVWATLVSNAVYEFAVFKYSRIRDAFEEAGRKDKIREELESYNEELVKKVEALEELVDALRTKTPDSQKSVKHTEVFDNNSIPGGP